MKQHILALGAAAALGFAGAAHAVVSFGDGVATTRPDPANPSVNVAPPQATKLEQNAGGIGHMLFAPYYNVQGNTATLINIANTDTKNGKAVKVRFRTASNSDDVLDFTLLLSPGDVWSGTLDTRDGAPTVSTADNSCVLPSAQLQTTGVPLKNDRLPSWISEEAKTLLKSEGYLEVLNMADIPQGSKLYTQIKHKNGTPPCEYESEILQDLILVDEEDQFVAPKDAAAQYGLYAPTGGLMGSWIIQNLGLKNSYSGNMTAIRAVDDAGVPGYTNLIFAPQNDIEIDAATLAAQFGKAIDTQYAFNDPFQGGIATVAGLTADPLLFSPGVVKPLWYDLPDMSTPLLTTTKTPQDQVTGLDLEQNQLFNFFVSDANAAAGVPMYTDWIVSQPTRRYYAAVDYDVQGILWNETMGADGAGGVAGHAVSEQSKVIQNQYKQLQIVDKGALGPFACLVQTEVKFGLVDTEESAGTTSLGIGAFSPGTPTPKETLCGEVIVLGFAEQSVFNAQTTRVKWPSDSKIPAAGMAQLTFKNPMPVVGFAATAYTDGRATGASYGATMPHRWN